MKKLEDINKKQIFTVPEGYFDTLPTIIQARILNENKPKAKTAFNLIFVYGAPVVLILIVALWLYYPSTQNSKQAEMMISKIETTDLIVYLNNEELTTNEILESINLNQQEVEGIETQAYQLNLSDKELNTLIDYY